VMEDKDEFGLGELPSDACNTLENLDFSRTIDESQFLGTTQAEG